MKFTRKNEDVRPFEPGGETSLEFYGTRSDCALYVLGSHTKKRPHNVVMGRLFDGRLYDALELGVSSYAGVHKFKAGTISQIGSKVGGCRDRAQRLQGQSLFLTYVYLESDPAWGDLEGLALRSFQIRCDWLVLS